MASAVKQTGAGPRLKLNVGAKTIETAERILKKDQNGDTLNFKVDFDKKK
jgi:hypothetical protein